MPSVMLLGDANCVYDDARAALKLFHFDCVAAVNNIGRDWPGWVDHWFTLHSEHCTDWVGIELACLRRVREGRNRPTIWSHKPAKCVDRVSTDWGGGSGLFAIKCLREIGFDAIVLCGMPMTSEGKHYYSLSDWHHASKYYRFWKKHYDEIAPYVRSMSGWTRQQFGAPSV